VRRKQELETKVRAGSEARIVIRHRRDRFVVYTDGRDTTRRGASRLVSRGLAIKLTRLFRM